MLPTPFINFIPQIYRDGTNQDDVQALATFMDQLIESIRLEIIEFCNTYDVARMPSSILDEVGYYLSADLQPIDSDRTKRLKVVNAVRGHRRRGSWSQDAKPKIDAIIGGDAMLVDVSLNASNDFILTGSGNVATEPTSLWSVLGGNTDGTTFGLPLIGSGSDSFLPGVVSIDIGSSTATNQQLMQIRISLQDVVPVYFIIRYGFVSGGIFYEYPNNFEQWLTSDSQQLTTSDGLNVISEVM